MRVVPVGRLVLDVRDVDRDAALALLGRLVDVLEPRELRVAEVLLRQTFVIAAVSVVLPWSMWPIVPTFRWGLLRSNFCFAMVCVLFAQLLRFSALHI